MAAKERRNINDIEQERKIPKQAEKFQATLNEMRKNKVDTDVIIEADGEEFHVHKIILTTGSAYFKKMFAKNIRECTSNRVKFTSIGKAIMKLIIDFLYFSDSDLPGNCDTVIELLKTAHILEIEALIEKCSFYLRNNINMSNWYKIWKLGDTYECDNIIGKIVEFTVKNLENIMQTAEFLQLHFQNLLNIIQEMNKRQIKCTNSTLKGILEWVKAFKMRENSLAKLLTAFSEIVVSKEFIESLLDTEPTVQNDAEVLCLLLRLQLRKKTNHFYFEPNDTTRVNSLCKLWNIQHLDFHASTFLSSQCMNIFASKQMPFKIKTGMTYVQSHNNIYFIGGEDNLSPATDAVSNRQYPKGSTTFIRYDISNNACTHLNPLPYPVYNAVAFLHCDKLHVIDRNNQEHSSSCIGQIYNTNDCNWYIINIPDAMIDTKMIISFNSQVYSLH